MAKDQGYGGGTRWSNDNKFNPKARADTSQVRYATKPFKRKPPPKK